MTIRTLYLTSSWGPERGHCASGRKRPYWAEPYDVPSDAGPDPVPMRRPRVRGVVTNGSKPVDFRGRRDTATSHCPSQGGWINSRAMGAPTPKRVLCLYSWNFVSCFHPLDGVPRSPASKNAGSVLRNRPTPAGLETSMFSLVTSGPRRRGVQSRARVFRRWARRRKETGKFHQAKQTCQDF